MPKRSRSLLGTVTWPLRVTRMGATVASVLQLWQYPACHTTWAPPRGPPSGGREAGHGSPPSEADGCGAPGEAAPDRVQHEQVAFVEASAAPRLVEREGHRGGRRVAVTGEVGVHALRGKAQVLRERRDDAAVCLMGDEKRDVLDAEPALAEQVARHLEQLGHRRAEEVRTPHAHAERLRPWGEARVERSASGQLEEVGLRAARAQEDAEHAPFSRLRTQDHGARGVAEERAADTVVARDHRAERIGADQQAGARRSA